jgi:membrane protease YdiL (CAAX protease family)
VRSCPACDATAPPDARWCGQCFAPFGDGPDGSAPAAAGIVDRFGLAVAAAHAPSAVVTAPVPVPPATLAPATLPPTTLPPKTLVPPTMLPGPAAPPGRRRALPDDGRMLSTRAAVLVAAAIGVGVLVQGLMRWLSHDPHREPETLLRYGIVLTVGLYAVVGALIVTQLVPGIRLRWHDGNPAGGVLFGATVGLGLGGTMLGIVSGAAGHLSSDPRIVMIMSEGDTAHILVAIAITCLCAPLVEEVLFRGILLEAFRRHHVVAAVAVSGFAFAVWHLNPSALRYYAVMGFVLGVLYLRRGLFCSMAAHFTFNGVLTAAAMAIVLSPGGMVHEGPVSVQLPGGWSPAASNADEVAIDGPSGAGLLLIDYPTPVAPAIDEVTQRIELGRLTDAVPGLTIDITSLRDVRLPAGPAVEVDITAEGHPGTIVFLPRDGQSVELVFLSGGSVKAQADFPHILDSVSVT